MKQDVHLHNAFVTISKPNWSLAEIFLRNHVVKFTYLKGNLGSRKYCIRFVLSDSCAANDPWFGVFLWRVGKGKVSCEYDHALLWIRFRPTYCAGSVSGCGVWLQPCYGSCNRLRNRKKRWVLESKPKQSLLELTPQCTVKRPTRSAATARSNSQNSIAATPKAQLMATGSRLGFGLE